MDELESTFPPGEGKGAPAPVAQTPIYHLIYPKGNYFIEIH